MIDLPGFKKEDIQVTVEDDCLTIAAAKAAAAEQENVRYLRRERYAGYRQRERSTSERALSRVISRLSSRTAYFG